MRSGWSRAGRQHVPHVLFAAARVDTADADLATALAALDQTDQQGLVRLARAHRVAPLLHERLRGVGGAAADQMMAALAGDRAAARARHLHTVRTLRRLSSALGVPFLLVKGAALAVGWYGDSSLRSYSDIDLLVGREDFGVAVESLVGAGFVELSTNWAGFLDHQVSEIPFGYESSCVDLHWDLVALGTDRREIRLDVRGLFDRAGRLALGSETVLTLDPADTLQHLCVGAGLGGARILLQLVDVDRVARDPDLDWGQFVARSRQAGSHALCLAVLARAHRILGTPLPDLLLADLRPFPGWATLTELVELPRRSERRLAAGVASGLVLASGRATLGRRRERQRVAPVRASASVSVRPRSPAGWCAGLAARGSRA